MDQNVKYVFIYTSFQNRPPSTTIQYSLESNTYLIYGYH